MNGQQALPRLLVSSVIACFTCVLTWGQATNSADVTGTVTDPSGAVAQGVVVTVRDIDKNTDRMLVANDSGVFDTGSLVPSDRYRITFERAGFAKLQRCPMTLTTGVTGLGVTGLNVQLTLGQSTQQVLIQAEAAPLLETATVDVSQTAPQETLRGVSANGSMPFSNALLDGTSTSSPMSNNVINTPIYDSVAEVKMSDSAFSAQVSSPRSRLIPSAT